MRNYTTYALGVAVLAPFALMLTSNPLVDIIALIYAIVVFNSPSIFPKTKRFWRAWHKQNFRIINQIK